MMKLDVKALSRSVTAFVKKRTPEILTGVGITGMITTTVLAVKATPKALMLIEERKLDLEVEKLPKLEIVKTVWPCYVPSVISGLASTACLIGASSVNMRRNAALAAAYALSETTLKEYQEGVIETIGEKRASEVRDEIAKKKVDSNPITNKEVVMTGQGETLCLEPLSGRYFRSDIEKVRAAVNNVNFMLLNDDYISLNDFYCELGLGETKMGEQLGWHIQGGKIDVHFSTHLAENGEPCLVIDLVNAPGYDYNKWL